MEKVDHKYEGKLKNSYTGKEVNTPYIVLLAKDNAVEDTLVFYLGKCLELGATKEHISGIRGLLSRVRKWREENPDMCKVPD
jgi:hypothetical protein